MINRSEILQTIAMIDQQHLDIRTITMGISLLDCADTDITRSCTKVYDKICRLAGRLVRTGEDIEAEFGIPIVNKRVSVTPISLVAAGTGARSYVPYAQALDRAAHEIGINFLGGFSAVCWTDFFQGMLMLAALMLTPILALFVMKGADFVAPVMAVPENYFNPLSGGGFNWKSVSDILSGLGWGLGYFGMPHILVRYLSIKSEHEMRKSQIIGCSWIVLILAMSAVVGLIGRQFLGEIDNENLVFVHMVRRLFPAFISGVLLSAILAAAMSTADSQLLASSSAFASDIYKPVIRKDATDHEMQWAGRVIVMLISVVAFFIAASPNCGGIMALVECAWAGFGSAFGPVILLSLYWRRLTYSGAIAGVCVGFVVDAVWYAFLSSSTGLYEIIPGFLCGLIAAVIVSLCSKAPSKEVTDLFDRAFEPTD